SVRLSTPISPSTPGLLLVGAHRLRAERLTTRVGSISPTSSGTKRDFYSALSFDRAAAGRAGPADALLRNPITGVAGCCARAASGHAATAPPSSVMNSRRLLSSTGLSLRFGRAAPGAEVRHCRSPTR